MLVRGLASLLLLAAAGCFAHRIAYKDLPTRTEYQAFSIGRPPNAHWYLEPVGPATAILRRELQPTSYTHSFFTLVGVGPLEREPKSHEEFGEIAQWRGQMTGDSDPRDSYRQSLATKQGQWCIRVELVEYEAGLIYVLNGYRCRHPARPNITLDFYYSERGLPDELDPRLYPEGEQVLEGVSIDLAPGEPVG